MTARLHLTAPGYDPRGDDLGPSLCGKSAVVVQASITGHPRACKTCVRLGQRRSFARVDGKVEWPEAIAEIVHVISGPRTLAHPPLTPELWRSMRCLDGRRCSCECCQIDEANRNGWAQWESEQQWRPHRRHAHDFGSVNAALELLLRWRQDGPSARSAHGSMQARCKEVGDLGTDVQTTRRSDREDLLIRRATQAADVERACHRAFAQQQERRGLTVDQCVSVLLSSVDAEAPTPAQWAERLEMSERAVKSLIGHGRKYVKAWLAAVEYTPEPPARDGVGPLIESMREAQRRT